MPAPRVVVEWDVRTSFWNVFLHWPGVDYPTLLTLSPEPGRAELTEFLAELINLFYQHKPVE